MRRVALPLVLFSSALQSTFSSSPAITSAGTSAKKRPHVLTCALLAEDGVVALVAVDEHGPARAPVAGLRQPAGEDVEKRRLARTRCALWLKKCKGEGERDLKQGGVRRLGVGMV